MTNPFGNSHLMAPQLMRVARNSWRSMVIDDWRSKGSKLSEAYELIRRLYNAGFRGAALDPVVVR